MSELRFNGQVAIVTGAGNGLGRSHALMLAARGAKVVVNDLGGDAFGGGKGSSAADKVVEEIKAAGGEAVANYDSVENGEAIVKTAVDAFGTVDIIINNAGILRDVSFAKMTKADWDIVLRVHLNGSMSVTHAAWPLMREKGYGRIVMTTSAAGIYGNFGQANYSAAKLGILGLANTLAVEGAAKNIHVNVIAPVAKSRLTETVMPPELLEHLRPEAVSPLVAWLCHEDCKENHGLFEVGAGYISKLRWQRTQGARLSPTRDFTIDDVAAKWDTVTNFEDAEHPSSIAESVSTVMTHINNPPLGGNQFIDLDAASKASIVLENSYDERDLALYALGIGAAQDPLDAGELKYVYEMSGEFQAFPTWGAMPMMNAMLTAAKQGTMTLPGCNFGFDRVLHGEQYTEIKRPLPRTGKLKHTFKLKNAWDKDPNAVVTFSIVTTDENGEEVAYNEMTSFVKGAGGWGGDRGPSGDENAPPNRKPDAVIAEKTDANQTLLYRLSGDWNPLHADPAFAKAFGYDRPILHGMCTFGYVARHVVKAFAKNDGRYFKSIKVRFAKSVFPGDTLETRMWRESDTRIILEARAKERDEVVIKNAVIELYKEIPKAAPKPVAKAEARTTAAAPSAKPAGMTPEVVFSVIDSYLKDHPDVAKKAGAMVQINLSEPDSIWTIDLKNGAGGAHAGAADKPDVTMITTTANFTKMSEGKADAQKMFFSGELKLEGNMMVAQKLDFMRSLDRSYFDEAVKKLGGGAAPATETAPAASTEPAGMTPAIAIFAINSYLQANPDVAKKAGAIVQICLTEPDSAWVIDLKNGAGSAHDGMAEKPDVTMITTNANFVDMCEGKADAQKLFFSGQLKLQGNMMMAQKLDFMRSLDRSYFDKAVKELQAKPAATSTTSNEPAKKSGRAPKAPDIFNAVAKRIADDGKLAKSVGAVLEFRVKEPEASWVIDLSAAKPTVKEGQASDAAATFTLTDKALEQLAGGAEPRVLFQKGELRVDGDVELAHKLDFLKA
jgi:3-hydroxyacyl-CoA dehydrogenase/3a,7a,12a-trihydroxy-5b-cholest-24-enoyl-CoA hydratase